MTIRKSAALTVLLLLGTALQVTAQEGASATQRAAVAAQAAKQAAVEAGLPQLQVSEQILPLHIPGHTLGETEGVSLNKAGHLFVYSRTGKGGTARGGTAAELYEFGSAPDYKFVKEWLPDDYAASFAHSVRIDKDQNVWIVDEGSGMVVESKPNGDLVREYGRKTEAIDYLESYLERGEKVENRHPVGSMGTFNRPTDICWDPAGASFITDGYGNSRVVKIGADGTWLKMVGTYGSGPNQFNTPHGIACDTDGNVYVGDRGNNRIQIYDHDLNFKETITGMGAPWSVQVTQKYIYSGDGTGKIYQYDRATHKELGWFPTSPGMGQTGCMIHELYAASDNVLIRGACSIWNVERITIKN
jgi:hypothetical protein